MILEYQVALSDPGAHVVQVTLTIPNPNPAGQTVQMARWIPGSYLIRELAKHVMTFEASSQGKPVAVTKPDNSTWTCAPTAGPLTLKYTLYAWDYSVRGAHFDTTHAFLDGGRIFLVVIGQEEAETWVRFKRPEGEAYHTWKIATALPAHPTEQGDLGVFVAPNYASLIDYPLEIGHFEEASFQVGDIPHKIVVTGKHYGSLKRLCAEMQKVCAYQQQLFGEPKAIQEYLFLLSLSHKGYGGLEHRNSSACQIARHQMPAEKGKLSKDARTVLGLLSHEYFHLWNVKRIKPAVFLPYNLSTPALTRQLWMVEGFTAYYDDLALLRSGVITVPQYLECLEKTITRVTEAPGQKKQSLSDASWDAWIKFYQPDENMNNANISYYAKGSLVALCLDLSLRQGTNNKTSLDDVMRYLWKNYGATQKGVPEDALEKMLRSYSTLLSDNLHQWLNEASELPLAEWLATAGITLTFKAAKKQKAGGWDLRFDLNYVVTYVQTGGEAHRVGVATGDTLIALDGIAFSDCHYKNVRKNVGCDKIMPLHVMRDDRLLCFDIAFRAPQKEAASLTLQENPAPNVLALRKSWMGE